MNRRNGDTIKSAQRMVQHKLRNKHSEEGTGDGPTSPKHPNSDRSFLAGGCKTIGATSRGCGVTTGCVAFGRRGSLPAMQHQPPITDFEPDEDHRGKQISRQQLVSDIKRVGRLVGRRPTTREIAKYSKFSQTAVENKFGTHSKAVAAAGYSDKPQETTYSDGELLTELRDAYRETGEVPRSRSDAIGPSSETYRDRFGSWINALREAGIEPEKQQTHTEGVVDRIEISELVDTILDLFSESCKIPYEKEVIQQIGDTQATTQIAGSWGELLIFAGLPARRRGGSFHDAGPRSKNRYGANWREIRRRILERDRYRCQHCAVQQHVEKENNRSLEVHHIKPLTSFEEPEKANFEENLITLCQSCHNDWEPVTQLAFDQRVQEAESQ